MTQDIAREYYRLILSSRCEEQRDDLLRYAADYARERALWKLASPEERIERDPHRSRVHDCFIDSCNILSRAQVKNGENARWRADLGTNRGEIGDFACYVTLFLSLDAR
jgi:hypothetical protein